MVLNDKIDIERLDRCVEWENVSSELLFFFETLPSCTVQPRSLVVAKSKHEPKRAVKLISDADLLALPPPTPRYVSFNIVRAKADPQGHDRSFTHSHDVNPLHASNDDRQAENVWLYISLVDHCVSLNLSMYGATALGTTEPHYLPIGGARRDPFHPFYKDRNGDIQQIITR